MKILVLSNLYPPEWVGGYELSCAQMVKWLLERGHEVRVCTSSSRYAPIKLPESNIERNLIFEERDRLGSLNGNGIAAIYYNSRMSQFHNLFQLIHTIEGFRPDLVYIFNILGLGGLAILDLITYLDLPWVWHLGDSIPSRLLEGVRKEALSISRTGRAGDFSGGTFISCSHRLVAEIEGRKSHLGNRVQVIPNWIDLNDEFRDKSYWTGGVLKCVYVGYIGEHKGVHLIIRAAKQLVDRGFRDFTIDLYGRGKIAEFVRLAAEYEVGGLVRFQGTRTQQELPSILRGFDIFLFPTREREPFGNVAIEAAAQGVVPILTRGIGCSEWFQHGHNCLTIDRSARAIVDAIMTIRDQPSRLANLARNAMVSVRSELNLDRIGLLVERVLQSACKEMNWEEINWVEAHQLFFWMDKIGREMQFAGSAQEPLVPSLPKVLAKMAYDRIRRYPVIGGFAENLANYYRRFR